MKDQGHFRGPVIQFVRDLFGFEDDLLRRARSRAEGEGLPLIEVAPEDGALLAAIVRLSGARMVVEVGTLFGYSAVWMGRALPPGGLLVTIEHRPRHARMARRTLEEAGLGERATVVEGDARTVLEEIEGEPDLVFIDADKISYPVYLAWARRRLAPGGIVLADNVLWKGQIVEPEDEEGRALRHFLETLATDPAWEATLVPTLEGMALAIRTESR